MHAHLIARGIAPVPRPPSRVVVPGVGSHEDMVRLAASRGVWLADTEDVLVGSAQFIGHLDVFEGSPQQEGMRDLILIAVRVLRARIQALRWLARLIAAVFRVGTLEPPLVIDDRAVSEDPSDLPRPPPIEARPLSVLAPHAPPAPLGA